jgi:hypothetical protein
VVKSKAVPASTAGTNIGLVILSDQNFVLNHQG